jgi:hypothetical protein
MSQPRMSAATLIQSRHSLRMAQLRELNRRASEQAAENPDRSLALDTDALACAAIIRELEHMADALGVTLDERIDG